MLVDERVASSVSAASACMLAQSFHTRTGPSTQGGRSSGLRGFGSSDLGEVIEASFV